MKDTLYLELDDKKLFIAKLKKTKNFLKLAFPCSNPINFSNNEIINGIICNPTVITQHIQDFFKEKQIKKASILLSLPSISKDEKLLRHQILQIALALTKINATIFKIVSHSLFQTNPPSNKEVKPIREIKKMHDHFLLFKAPPSSNPYPWLLTLIMILALALPFLVSWQQNKKQELELLSNEIARSRLRNNKFQGKAHHSSETKQKQSKLSAAIAQISKAPLNSPAEILTFLSQEIPPNTWITELKIYRIKENKKKHVLEIHGKTTSNKELSPFLEKLHHFNRTSNIQLALFEEVKNTTAPLFRFIISGIL